MRAVYAASDEGALPAVVSHQPTLRTTPVNTRTDDCGRAGSQFSKNKPNQKQGWPMSEREDSGTVVELLLREPEIVEWLDDHRRPKPDEAPGNDEPPRAA